MALLKKLNDFLKSDNDTGFGNNASSYGGRFINKDGSFNIRKEGMSFWKRASVYQNMLTIPVLSFVLILVALFLAINLFYTLIYFSIGSAEFTGMLATSKWKMFEELFFFSTETFTTVGYGRVNPIGTAANFVAAIEAMSGFLSFAVVTGLIYGRFSKPKAYVAFSENALVSPYRGGVGLMFRLVSFKETHIITGAEVKVTTAFKVDVNGKQEFKFYELPLERNRVDMLNMNWTVVHPIDEKSPLYGFTQEDMKNADLEIYVTLKGFDDVFSNTVLTRTSYTFDEIIFDAKFIPMYKESEDGSTTILFLDKLNHFVKVGESAGARR